MDDEGVGGGGAGDVVLGGGGGGVEVVGRGGRDLGVLRGDDGGVDAGVDAGTDAGGEVSGGEVTGAEFTGGRGAADGVPPVEDEHAAVASAAATARVETARRRPLNCRSADRSSRAGSRA